MKKRLLFFLISTLICGLCEHEASAQWYQISQLQNYPVTCFLVTSDSNVFIGGYFRYLVHSTDGGKTWVNSASGIPADTILSLASAGGYIFAGTSAGVYRSSDNGGSWQVANTGIIWGGAPVNQFATVDTTVYVATDGGIFRSTDFGTSWVSANNGLGTIGTSTVRTFGIISTPLGLIATQDLLQGAYILRPDSTTWRYIGLGTQWCDASALAAIDTILFAGTQGGVFMYSGKDTTWLPRSNGIQGSMQFCFFATTDSLIFIHAGYIGEIFMSSDLGQNWKAVDDSVFAGASVNAIAANKDYLFAGTSSGAWRIPIDDVITFVNVNHLQVPGEYTLSQNFPNPFNPSTVISYQLPLNGMVALKIYDILGREVETLVNERQTAGNHSVTFNASNLPSGVYFYRLEAGTFSQTKKLVLLK
ncbi:MAG TPA: T9SS type A sorting domain-containing protein [Candidatus Kryptonia bacterium]